MYLVVYHTQYIAKVELECSTDQSVDWIQVEDAEAEEAEMEGKIRHVVADASTPDGAQLAVRQCLSEFGGKICALVNNCAVQTHTGLALHELPLEVLVPLLGALKSRWVTLEMAGLGRTYERQCDQLLFAHEVRYPGMQSNLK